MRIAMQARLLLGGVSLFAFGPAMAAVANDALDNSAFEEIIVNAVRIPTPQRALPNRITVIDREELANQMTVSTSILDAVSAKVPSFSPTRQKLTGAGETMRGRDPLYMIDGVPQSNPLRDGSRDGVTLDPAVIERVEVLYGANAIQGIGGTGGVINYVTLSPSEERGLQARLEAGITSTGRLNGDGFGYRGAATLLNDFGAADVVLSVAGETRGAFYDGTGNRIGIDNVQGDLQDSKSLNLFAKVGVNLDDKTRAQVMVNIFDIDGEGDYVPIDGDRTLGIPTSAVKGSYEGDPTYNTVRTLSADFTRSELAGGTLTVQGFYQDFKAVFGGGVFASFQDPTIDPTGNLFDQSANQSEKYGLKFAYSHQNLFVPGLSAVLGLDYLHDETEQSLVQTGRAWVPPTSFESWAPFIQLNQDLMEDRLHVSGGVRLERATLNVDTFQTLASYGPQTVDGGSPGFSEELWNGGISFEAASWLTAYASYAQGFTMADVGRVLRSVSTPNEDVDTFLNVEPVIADNIEIGFKVNTGRFRADIGYFWSSSDFGQRLVADSDGIFNVSREKTKINGFEASGEFAASDDFSIGASYAALTGRFDSDDDGKVDQDLGGRNISPDRLNLFASWTPMSNFDGRIQTSVYFDRNFDDGTEFDGYVLVDARLGYNAEGYGRFDLAVQNLLDKQYITYFSQTASTANSAYYAGRGRTLTLRWTGSF